MRKIAIGAVCAAFLLSVFSCGKCFITDCAKDDVKLIYFLSQADSTDLITSGKYKLDSLKITPLKLDQGGETPGYEINFSTPYLVAIAANANAKGYVFQLDTLPPDTLLTLVGFDKGDKCCDGVHTFDKIVLNGDTLINTREDLSVPIFK